MIWRLQLVQTSAKSRAQIPNIQKKFNLKIEQFFTILNNAKKHMHHK